MVRLDFLILCNAQSIYWSLHILVSHHFSVLWRPCAPLSVARALHVLNAFTSGKFHCRFSLKLSLFIFLLPRLRCIHLIFAERVVLWTNEFDTQTDRMVVMVFGTHYAIKLWEMDCNKTVVVFIFQSEQRIEKKRIKKRSGYRITLRSYGIDANYTVRLLFTCLPSINSKTIMAMEMHGDFVVFMINLHNISIFLLNKHAPTTEVEGFFPFCFQYVNNSILILVSYFIFSKERKTL